jgi:putative hydrolase of the HAD superfamily
MRFRAVLFDYFNTLTTAVQRGPRHAKVAQLLGCDPTTWVNALDRSFMERARGGYGSAVEGLRRLAAEAGGQPSLAQVLAAIEARVEAVQADVTLRPDTIPTRLALRSLGLHTAVISDCWFELPMFLPRTPLARLVDAQVYSVAVGSTKPDAVMYLTACEALGVEPDECMYVGDGGSHELTGAHLLGMTAVRLAAPDLGGHLTFEADANWHGPVITSLAHLPLILQRTPVPA